MHVSFDIQHNSLLLNTLLLTTFDTQYTHCKTMLLSTFDTEHAHCKILNSSQHFLSTRLLHSSKAVQHKRQTGKNIVMQIGKGISSII